MTLLYPPIACGWQSTSPFYCACAGITHIVRPEDYPVMPVEHVRLLSFWGMPCTS